ncbi:hypothetical protein Bca52824_025809 [Brassica carinata]|uniref:Uncharacterized protein n=1 Tax=Brassica carinata TaxID=52824 RepID=A0A8X7V9M1_BRACI|nr:hypothetical protein Bca52824_025809 [Brassica carinata]
MMFRKKGKFGGLVTGGEGGVRRLAYVDERVIRHLVMKRDEDITENCPPPPEFHSVRTSMNDVDDFYDDDEEEEEEEGEGDDVEYEVDEDGNVVYGGV